MKRVYTSYRKCDFILFYYIHVPRTTCIFKQVSIWCCVDNPDDDMFAKICFSCGIVRFFLFPVSCSCRDGVTRFLNIVFELPIFILLTYLHTI